MQIRLRERQDLIHIEAIARALHASDDYPRYRPDDDVAGLLRAPEMISSLVAVTNGTIVGHVALHWRSSRQVVDLVVDRLGVAAARLGVVARLLVDPSIRRAGVAKALLQTAEQDALDRRLVPVLDVVDKFAPAISLYERQGWQRLGTVTIKLEDDMTMNEHVDAAPSR